MLMGSTVQPSHQGHEMATLRELSDQLTSVDAAIKANDKVEGIAFRQRVDRFNALLSERETIRAAMQQMLDARQMTEDEIWADM